jgi:hypothetical protein
VRGGEEEYPAPVAWKILGALGEQDGPDVDARLWLFEVNRGQDRRRVEVLVTGQARDLPGSPQVRRAAETSGRSALADALEAIGDGEPPARITVTANGIDY